MTTSIWDSALPNNNEEQNDYPVSDPGEFQFQVVEAKGKEYLPSGSSKISRCAEIDVRLRVEGKINGQTHDVTVFDRLYADPKTVWKMTAFAKSIGVFKEGMTPGDLLKSIGDSIGNAEIGVREYNGSKQNEVKRYIPLKEKLPF